MIPNPWDIQPHPCRKQGCFCRLFFSTRRAARWIPSAGTVRSHNGITQHELLSCKQISARSVRVLTAELLFI